MGIFFRDPWNESQAIRWTLELEILESEIIETHEKMIDALVRHNHRQVSPATIRQDFDALHVIRVHGAYTQVSATGDAELVSLLRMRLRAAAETIQLVGRDHVRIKTNEGAANWISPVIKELNEWSVSSIQVSLTDDEIQLWTREGDGEKVLADYLLRLRGVREGHEEFAEGGKRVRSDKRPGGSGHSN